MYSSNANNLLNEQKLRFLKTTSHIVRSSIDEEASQAKGYVDVLRWLVVTARSPGETEAGGEFFRKEVKSACGIKGNVVCGLRHQG